MEHFYFQTNKDWLKQMSREIRDRERLDNLADLYSIIIAVEHLERAYLRDALPQQLYTNLLNKLISQYQTASSNVNVVEIMADTLTNVLNFINY